MKRSRSSTLASSVLNRLAGTSTLRCFAPIAFRIPVRKSATGSLTDIVFLLSQRPRSNDSNDPAAWSVDDAEAPAGTVAHQLDLTTPGIWPVSARSRKQM